MFSGVEVDFGVDLRVLHVLVPDNHAPVAGAVGAVEGRVAVSLVICGKEKQGVEKMFKFEQQIHSYYILPYLSTTCFI